MKRYGEGACMEYLEIQVTRIFLQWFVQKKFQIVTI